MCNIHSNMKFIVPKSFITKKSTMPSVKLKITFIKLGLSQRKAEQPLTEKELQKKKYTKIKAFRKSV